MRTLLTSSSLGLLTLALLSNCGGGGSHAPDGGKAGTGGAGTGGAGTGGGGTGGGGTGGTDAGTAGMEGGTDAGPDAGSCMAAGICGGNIVGSWSIASSCLDVDVSGAVPDYCPAATAQAMGFQVTGTLKYNANLAYSRQTTIMGSIVITFPASCLTGADGGAPLTCAQLKDQLLLDLNYTAVNCTAAGSACACTGMLAPQTQTKVGMYTIPSAGLLVEAETGRTPPDMSDYCIKTDTLTISPHAAGMSASGTITATRVPVPDAGADGGSDGGSDASPEAASDVGPDVGSDATTGN